MQLKNRFPLPPWDMDTAAQKLQLEEDAWNTHDPAQVSQGYAPDTEGREGTDFLNGRAALEQFLARKWAQELDYKVKKDLWGALKGRMAVRFEAEWRDAAGQWYHSYGTEVFEYNDQGYVQRHYASANALPIAATDRKL